MKVLTTCHACPCAGKWRRGEIQSCATVRSVEPRGLDLFLRQGASGGSNQFVALISQLRVVGVLNNDPILRERLYAVGYHDDRCRLVPKVVVTDVLAGLHSKFTKNPENVFGLP